MFFVLGGSAKRLPFLTFVFLGVSLIDLIGLSLVGPYLALVLGDEQDMLFVSLSSYFASLGDFSRQEILSSAGLLLVLVYLIKTIVAAKLARVVIEFGQYQQVRLKTLLISKYLSLPYQEYVSNNQAHYMNIINVLTAQFANMMMIILQVWGDLIVATVIVGLLIWTNPKIFFLLIMLLSFWLISFDYFTRRKLETYGRENIESSQDIYQHADQALAGFKEIKIFALRDFFVEKLHSSAERFANGQTGVNFITMIPKYLLELVIVAFLVCYCFVVVWSEQSKELMLPTLGVFGVAAIRLLPILRNFTTSLNRIRSNKLCLEILARDLGDVTDQNNEMDNRPVEKKALSQSMDCVWKLRLSDYCFHYPDDQKLILDCINLTIKAGEKIGIVGRSGSGKSSLLNGILGLLPPTGGTICYNGVPLRDACEDWWQKIAYVPQETFVIDDTIGSNILLGSDKVDFDRLLKAVEVAGLAEEIEAMAEGFDTLVGGGGVRLSGGQKQRLALARAIYTGRKVMVLDEAMSALDQETERQILDKILAQSSLTVIIISHREKTLGKCTRILRVLDGSLIEENSIQA
jgi:ABC-type multidrug transport system fused ATPase/permease subunit